MTFVDCPRPPPLQHHWHCSLVPDSSHPHPHPTGQRPRQRHRLLPLVCRRLHPGLLLHAAALHLQPVACWLAGTGGRGRTSTHSADCHHSD